MSLFKLKVSGATVNWLPCEVIKLSIYTYSIAEGVTGSTLTGATETKQYTPTPGVLYVLEKKRCPWELHFPSHLLSCRYVSILKTDIIWIPTATESVVTTGPACRCHCVRNMWLITVEQHAYKRCMRSGAVLFCELSSKMSHQLVSALCVKVCVYVHVCTFYSQAQYMHTHAHTHTKQHKSILATGSSPIYFLLSWF